MQNICCFFFFPQRHNSMIILIYDSRVLPPRRERNGGAFSRFLRRDLRKPGIARKPFASQHGLSSWSHLLAERSVKPKSLLTWERDRYRRTRIVFRPSIAPAAMHGHYGYASRAAYSAQSDSGFLFIRRFLPAALVRSRSPLVLCLTRQSVLRGNAFNYKRKRATVAFLVSRRRDNDEGCVCVCVRL